MKPRCFIPGFVLLGFAGVPVEAIAQEPNPQVAVVNIGLVFSKYEKAMSLKKEMELTLQPYRTRGETLKEKIQSMLKEAASEATPAEAKEELSKQV